MVESELPGGEHGAYGLGRVHKIRVGFTKNDGIYYKHNLQTLDVVPTWR